MVHVRLASLVMATAMVGGCNLVVTDKPLFSKADGAGGPQFRTGVWNGAAPDCAFDEAKPEKDWPKCANAQPPGADPPPWLAVPGDPPILQMSTEPGNGSAISPSFYVGFHVIRTDSTGRVIEVRVWPVQCGPPPPDGDKSGLTKHMLSGLKERKEGGDCTAETKQALRNAARASEAWVPGPATKAHWVRDPILGDLQPDTKP